MNKKVVTIIGKLIFLLIIGAYGCITLYSQSPKLKEFIGQGVKPNDSDVVCDIPFATDKTFNSYGYQIGDTIPDFTLYTLGNEEFNIRNELSKGKPILIVTGSYTCPVFRLRYKNLNAIAKDFGDRISSYFVYVVEAHPIVDVSPYTKSPGEVWVTPQNEEAQIFFRQPKTYLERKQMVQTVKQNLEVIPEILIDGPCNEYWTHFGPGAVIAYLITPDGLVAARNSWFNSWMNNKGYNMLRDIRTLVAKTTEFDKNTFFSTSIIENTIKGLPGKSLELTADITNTSNKEMFIDISVADQTIPMDWMVNFSPDGGFPIDMDSVVMYLKPNETKTFRLAFKTGKKGEGYAKMLFKNSFNPNNREYIEFYGQADSSFTSINEINNLDYSYNIYPNPTANELKIDLNLYKANNIAIELCDLEGKLLQCIGGKEYPQGRNTIILDVSNVVSGNYIIKFSNKTNHYIKKVSIIK